jgi:ribonuclease P protein component
MTTIRNLTSFSTHEIRELFKVARSVITTPFVDIRKAPTKHSEGKILIVVPRRVGNAVHRNKLRRRVKELFVAEKGYTQGSDFIFLAKSPEIASLPFEELKILIQQAIA